VQVDEHDVEATAPHHLDRFVSTAGRTDVVAVGLEHAGASIPEGPLIVDDEDPDGWLRFGRDGERIERSPGGESI